MSLLGTIGLITAGAVIGDLLSPGTKGLGNLISGGTWRQSGQEIASQEFNAGEAQKQRDWEEQMSSTAYQRSMVDLKAAGLNPSLIYGTGGAATTPAGSAAHTAAVPQTNNLVGNLAGILNSVSNLMNSSTRQLANDRYSKHLDYKERDEIQHSTNKIYNNAGELISTIVKDFRSGK